MTYLHGSLLINHSRRKKIKPLSFYFEDASLSKARIFPGDQIFITKPNVQGGAIDNIKNEIDLDIGFDMKLIKRDELYINLIHFDKSMTNPENYKYFNKFKVDIVGGFYAIDDLDILKNYLEKIKNKDIPFIVISSGSSGKDVIPLCKNYSFVKEVIIFCLNYEYNKHYLSEYPGYVKKVLTSISSVYDYIKTFGADKYKQGIENFHFSLQEIEMNRQFQQCPVITASEYDKCYFLVHRAYSHFFGNMDNIYEYSNFDGYNYQKTINGLKKIKLENNSYEKLKDKFDSLVNIYDNNIFVEEAIRSYTQEGDFCYLFNRIMRYFEPGLISFAYYMGPFMFGVNKFLKENPSFAMQKDMTLYRTIKCSKIDLYLYKINLGHIICFPALSSTSSEEIDFDPTSLSQKTSGNYNNDTIKIKMIFKYKYKIGDISPGIIIEEKKGQNGEKLSEFCEKEVLLLPFTFARITKINEEIPVIELEIINRNSSIEYTLKNDVENRFLFSSLD